MPITCIIWDRNRALAKLVPGVGGTGIAMVDDWERGQCFNGLLDSELVDSVVYNNFLIVYRCAKSTTGTIKPGSQTKGKYKSATFG